MDFVAKPAEPHAEQFTCPVSSFVMQHRMRPQAWSIISKCRIFTPENFTVLWLEAPAELPEEDKKQESVVVRR